ncbi:MAG: peptidoglycan-binding protein [bacterium]
MTKATSISKIAAVAAGLAMAASLSFVAAVAPAHAQSQADLQAQIATLMQTIAALQAQVNGSTTTTTSTTFTRDLTIGSTGADVTALQTWLIAKGFAIPAGATGYFGAQTKAALAAWQAANGVSPAAGYFGPITRAKVASMSATTTTTTTTGGSTTTTTTTLKGGEADLTDFDLRSEDGDGAEGEQDVKLATAKFDVDGGDVNVQRAELTVEFTGSGSASERPWDYFDTISVWGNGKKLADVNADSRADWDDQDDGVYTISVSGFDYMVRDGSTAELTFAADIADNMDDDDVDDGSFDLSVETDQGIRAIDAAGIQQYTGKTSDKVGFDFQAEENGDLSIRESDENPDATTLKVENDQSSDAYDVFAWDVRNKDNADTLITDFTITVATSSDLFNTADVSDIIRKATVSDGDDEYDGDINDDGTIDFDDIEAQVDGDSTKTFTLSVEFASDSGYASDLPNTITFAIDHSSVEAEGVESGDEVESTDISGSATSEDHMVSETGFDVAPKSTSQSVTASTDNSDAYGTFIIKFDVTADEDDPIFIGKTAASSTLGNDTAGAVYDIIKNGATTSVAFDSKTATLSSTAHTKNGNFKVDAGATETFTLTVTLDPLTLTGTGQYAIQLAEVNYSVENDLTPLSKFNVDLDNADYETDAVYITAD